MSEWVPVEASVYAQAYAQYGGSVRTHPDFITGTSEILRLEPSYLASYDDTGELVGALPRWGQREFGNTEIAIRCATGLAFDWGQMEVIYPLKSTVMHTLPPGPQRLSCLHADNIVGVEKAFTAQALFRTAEWGGQSKAFHRRHRYMLNRFIKKGGRVDDVADYDAEEVAWIYCELHRKRRNKPPAAFEGVLEFFKRRPQMICGKILVMNESDPVAVQFLVMSECENWVSVEYINGGMDLEYRDLSVGSVLLYANTTHMWEYAQSNGKLLRYSFGFATPPDRQGGYKARYCERFPTYNLRTY